MPVVEAAARSYQCFPMDHPLYQSTALGLAAADLVLVLETDVPWMPGSHEPAAGAFVAAIDIDPVKAHMGTYEFTADLRLTADSLAALGALQHAIERLIGDADRERFGGRAQHWARASQARIDEDERRAQDVATQSPISPLWLSREIGRSMDANCLMLDETLMVSPLPRYLRFSEAGSYFRNPGSGGGWAAGAALGAKLGRPDKDVVAVSGDGFYMYSNATSALTAAIHHGAPYMSVIFQNCSYSTGTRATASAYPDGYAARGGFKGGYFEQPMDFAKEAEAAGAHGENVHDPAEVAPALRRGRDQIRQGKPAVIAVRLPRLTGDLT
jgi:acetolactate synthase I/II/III large subunit